MPRNLTNKPRILRGAFVEYGLRVPPLSVVFQFNPEQLSRSRSLSVSPPGAGGAAGSGSLSAREIHRKPEFVDLIRLRDEQKVDVQEESISFDIRLDATDKLNDGDLVAAEFGIVPQLTRLEMMMRPRQDSFTGALADDLLRRIRNGYSYTKKPNPPMILFIWGRRRVLPVNITSMNITETEFNAELNPVRATVSVSLDVIEGGNGFSVLSDAMSEQVSLLDAPNIADIANVVIPG